MVKRNRNCRVIFVSPRPLGIGLMSSHNIESVSSLANGSEKPRAMELHRCCPSKRWRSKYFWSQPLPYFPGRDFCSSRRLQTTREPMGKPRNIESQINSICAGFHTAPRCKDGMPTMIGSSSRSQFTNFGNCQAAICLNDKVWTFAGSTILLLGQDICQPLCAVHLLS